MERILVPLDGSQLAEEVLTYAKRLATHTSGTIYLVRVVPSAQQLAAASFAGAASMEGVSVMNVPDIDRAVALQLEEARAYLQGEARKLQAEGFLVEWEVRQGVAADEIIKCARNNRIDIIAISSHGRSGLGRLVFGSVSDRVLREAGIPVMVVKHPKGGGPSGSGEDA